MSFETGCPDPLLGSTETSLSETCPWGEQAIALMSRDRQYPPGLLDRGARHVIESSRRHDEVPADRVGAVVGPTPQPVTQSIAEVMVALNAGELEEPCNGRYKNIP